MNKEILDFYKQTSCYTDLGFYKDFAKNLPDDLATLMLNPNTNFSKLKEIWENNPKFRIMSGGLN